MTVLLNTFPRNLGNMRISVAGNMGAGKSSILHALEMRDYPCVPEPVDTWSEWLTDFYRDPDRHAFSFQTKILYDFSQLRKNTSDGCTWIIERSPLESKVVFGAMVSMDEKHQKLYGDLYRELAWEPDFILYLRTDPETAYKRVQNRNRASETNVSFAYIRDLHKKYETFAETQSRYRPVVTIDAGQDFTSVLGDVLLILNTIHDPLRYSLT